MNIINLISDTITKPSKGMLDYMYSAEVGDDVFGEDPTINRLQEKAAKMFGKEAALFCPSGTMTNQIAIKVNTKPLDEIICDHYSHVYQYETGGYAFNSGVAVNLIHGQYGKITADQIKSAVKPVYDWLPISKLVVLENSCNKGGGSYYTIDEVQPIKKVCDDNGLILHLDGARLFNVIVETNEDPKDIGAEFETISICVSKGLGAPVGSLLLGPKGKITDARRFRKVMGGGMRQAGYLAAACEYALDNNILRLKEDNNRAKILGVEIEKLPYIQSVYPVHTNIVIFELGNGLQSEEVVEKLKTKGINCAAFGHTMIRFVTHMHIGDDEVNDVVGIMRSLY
ncbi:MAG TPA: threonine aldolase [Saprospirales bacterium]|mgnify:FL=1|nr:threonine aldolase [Saprospiraceae bacterium]HAV28495.1 threonine aldolase [Saprospirales bacterium]HAW04231.1 threonine aldolase [Saprospirales bacterium]